MKGSIVEMLARVSLIFLFLSSIKWQGGQQNVITWFNDYLGIPYLNDLSHNTLWIAVFFGVMSLLIFRGNFIISFFKRIPFIGRLFKGAP